MVVAEINKGATIYDLVNRYNSTERQRSSSAWSRFLSKFSIENKAIAQIFSLPVE